MRTYKYLLNVEDCDNRAAYRSCDECTPPQGNAVIENCGTFDIRRGRPLRITEDFVRANPWNAGYCLQCVTCEGSRDQNGLPLYYHRDAQNQNTKCVTNKQEQCAYTHRDISNNPARDASVPFVWIGGKKRMQGVYRQKEAIFYSSLVNNNAPENRQSDTLPSYQACTTAELTPRPPAYRLRNFSMPPPQGGSENYMKFESWNNDCSERSLYECANGHYFSESQSTFSTLDCKKCPVDNPGGLLPYCQCPPGWANNRQILDALVAADASLNRRVRIPRESLDDVSCSNCRESVSIGGSVESIYCAGSFHGQANVIKRCNADQYLNATSNQCETCAQPGAIPTSKKDGCLLCEPGTYSDGARCVECDGRVEFCESEGMVRPKPKKLNCSGGGEAGLMFKSNNDAKRDNECVPCPVDCAGGMAFVYAAGHNASNACSDRISGKRFYACFSQGDSQPVDKHEFMRMEYRYNATDGTTYCEVDPCTDHGGLLPPHATWVHGPAIGGRQCVFACRHGWRTDLALELRRRIHSAVYEGRRIDLQPFLESIEMPTGAARPRKMHPTRKANWPEGSNEDSDLKWWAREVPTAFTSEGLQSRAHMLENTFLFVDEVMREGVNGSLCLSPGEAYSAGTGCPSGFTMLSDPESLECALAARERGVFSYRDESRNGTVYETVVLDAAYARIACVKESAKDTMWIPYQKCSSCLDMHHDALQERLTVMGGAANAQARRIETIAVWLLPARWKTFYDTTKRMPYSSPYNFIDAANPCATNRGHDSFTFSVQAMEASEIRVNIPCALEVGEGNRVCAALTGSERHRYDLSETCQDGKSAMPCVFCNASRSLASDYSSWLGKEPERETWEARSKVCNYLCPEGSVSNPDEATYQSTPCLACEALVGGHVCEQGVAEYFDASAELARCMTTSANHGGMKRFVPQCTACVPLPPLSDLVFVQRVSTNNSECLALCSPDTFRTLLVNASETRSAVPQGQIGECRRCTDSNVISCNNSNCSAGFFLNESCLPCNTSRCEAPGYYRPSCPANSIADPQCTRCDERRLLYNDGAQKATSDSIARALAASMLSPSRRWISSRFVEQQADNNISVFASEEGCAVACINNYVWIDLRKGAPPADTGRLLRPEYACLPCSFLGEQLFSVWNHSLVFMPLTDPPAILGMMQGRSGGCMQCPPNTETIASIDRMCMAKPGFGQNTNSGVSVEMVTVVVNVTSNQGSLSLPVVNAIRSLFLPAVEVGSNRYMRCCDNVGRRCKVFAAAQLDIDQWSILGDTFYTRCRDTRTGALVTVPRRSLLQASSSLEQCLAGQYNHIRGNTVCFSCPRGASTPGEGVPTNESCRCLSGYYAQRHPLTRAWERCLECGWNRHRTIGMDDSFCAACPPGKNTPSATSANCYCNAGTYYNETTRTCMPCEAGGYCESGAQRVECPDNSWSEPGAKTRSDCVCNNATHYGTLANPGSVCYRTPPTMRCLGSCECAPGWRPMYSTSADGLLVIKACVTECETGQYAIIDPVTFERRRCEPCPLNTYSSSKQAVDPGEGRTPCTPCPPRFETVSTGSTAPSQCLCMAGVSDGQGCGSCPADTYLDPFSRRCKPCPSGATSAEGSVGYFACMCARGTRSSIRQSDLTLQCEPCPRNTYAPGAGFSCTPCPSGMITLAPGSTTPRDCVCQEGQIKYAGECVAI